MKTKQKGDIALTQAIAYFVANGYEVLLPIGDRTDYDCVIEKNGILQKVQVKFAGIYNCGTCKVGLRITGGNQSRNYIKKYTEKSFDILFVYTEKKDMFFIPWNNITARNELTIEDKKYIKYKV